MIALSSHTAAAIAFRAAEGSWIVFLQVIPSVGSQGPIKIEGLKGTQLAERLTMIARDNAFEVQLIGLMPTLIPKEHAEAIAAEHEATHLHDGWFAPTNDLVTFIQHAAQDAIQILLEQTPPSLLNGDQVVSIDEMAAILKISVPTIRRLVKADAIPYFKLGKAYRFVPADVIASLQRNER